MKKVKVVLAIFFALTLGVFCLGACNSASMEGTYCVDTAQTEINGTLQEYHIGDTLPNGVVMKKELCNICLKSDGSIEINLKLDDQIKTMTGTWTTVEGVPNRISITIDDDPLDCDCDGSSLVISPLGSLFILTMKK